MAFNQEDLIALKLAYDSGQMTKEEYDAAVKSYSKQNESEIKNKYQDKDLEALKNAFESGQMTRDEYELAVNSYLNKNKNYLETINKYQGSDLTQLTDDELQNLLLAYQGNDSSVTPGGGYQDKINQIKNLIDSRQQLSSDNAYLQDYLANAPSELAKTREEFFKGQRKSSIDYLNQYVIPEQITPYEQSGLATDREVSKMISNLYSGVNTNLQEEEINQAIQDVNFFSDAAYKTKLQELVNSRGNLKAQIDSDFQTARQQQQQGFLKTQQATQNKFDLDMFQRENERALQQYQQKLQQQQSSQKKANEAAMFGGIGSVLGGVAGAAVAGPVGAAVGSSAGGLAGNVKGAA